MNRRLSSFSIVLVTVLSTSCGHQGGAAAAGASAESPEAAAHESAAAQVPASAVFPTGTVLGDLELPVYPTPQQNTQPSESNSNEAGEKSVSVSMTPQDPFDTVVAWYKARMPAGSYAESLNPKHAQFQIGESGDKMIRMVIIDNINDTHAHLILMKTTYP